MKGKSMKTGNNGSKTTEREVVGAIKVVESVYRLQRPIFEDVKIERPIYSEKQVEVPAGFDEVADKMADMLFLKLSEKVDRLLEKAITKRISEIKVPKIIYEEEIRPVPVDRVVFNDVSIERPTYKDREVINPVLKNVDVVNAKIKDVEIDRPVYKDHVIPRAIFEDVIIQKPKYVDKEVTVISLKYVDPQGNPEQELK